MSIIALALIGKSNEPLYFFSSKDHSFHVNLQMIAHSGLDVVEERKKKAQSTSGTFDMYFGLLFPVEEYRVYGSYTNTHQKIVVICDANGAENVGVREAMTALGAAFVNNSQNPFQIVEAPLVSKRLDTIVHQIITKQNSLIQKKR